MLEKAKSRGKKKKEKHHKTIATEQQGLSIGGQSTQESRSKPVKWWSKPQE